MLSNIRVIKNVNGLELQFGLIDLLGNFESFLEKAEVYPEDINVLRRVENIIDDCKRLALAHSIDDNINYGICKVINEICIGNYGDDFRSDEKYDLSNQWHDAIKEIFFPSGEPKLSDFEITDQNRGYLEHLIQNEAKLDIKTLRATKYVTRIEDLQIEIIKIAMETTNLRKEDREEKIRGMFMLLVENGSVDSNNGDLQQIIKQWTDFLLEQIPHIKNTKYDGAEQERC